MNSNFLQILNEGENVLKEYDVRPTVKAVIINNNHEVLLFANSLIGGGVDEGETLLEALDRECLEEAGITVNVFQEVGTVIQYRDYLKKKYEVHGYLAHYGEKIGNPTTDQESEIGKKTEWKTFDEAIQILKNKITSLENSNLETKDDSYQGSLYNAKTHLLFLEEARKNLNL